MAPLRKEFTRGQHRSYTRRVCKCQLFLRSVLCDGISCLDQKSSLHYLPRKVKFYSLSFHVIDIKRLFRRNKLLYYLERCPFTDRLVNNIHISSMVAVTLYVKNYAGASCSKFHGVVVSSKILRIFR